MVDLADRAGQALLLAAGMAWQVGWSLVLGLLISAVLQAVVSQQRMTAALGRDRLRDVALATLAGAASSSCSYAAVAVSRTLLRRGAALLPSLAFLFASTNLVAELGIVLTLLMGWQFMAGEWLGGVVLIGIMSLLVRLTYPVRLVAEARRMGSAAGGHVHGASGHGASGHGASGHAASGHAASGAGASGAGASGHGASGAGASGHQHDGHRHDGHQHATHQHGGGTPAAHQHVGGPAEGGAPGGGATDGRAAGGGLAGAAAAAGGGTAGATAGGGAPLWAELAQRRTWQAIAGNFAMDWSMLWKDLVLGFLIAGALGAFVPDGVWRAVFITGANPWLQVPANALLGPLVAVLTFVCSIGNVPMAAVLWGSGVSFGGVLAFLYGDLIVLPVLDAMRRAFGWRMAAYIAVVFYATMVAAGILMDLAFSALGWIPAHRAQAPAAMAMAGFSLNYTFWLNLVFGALAATLFVLARQQPAAQASCCAHHGHAHHHH
jgi:uncharacterized membrane protein YraQ (UPF0718 family)